MSEPGGETVRPEALRGVRVLDITRVIYGPWAGTLLAELGAEVIHVELPGAGDVLVRPVAPRGKLPRNISSGLLCANANKYFVAIDLRKPEGVNLVRRLALRSDILLENFKPGTFDSWGIGYRQLRAVRPDLIYVSMSGFGNWGPLSDRPSYDAYAQGVTGLAEITGFPGAVGVKSSAWIGDFLAGTYAAFVALVALVWRRRTGKGQFIDLAQTEVLLRCMDWTWPFLGLTGRNRARSGNRDLAAVVGAVVRAADAFVAVGALEEKEFQGLCRAMGREDLLPLAPYRLRTAKAHLIYEGLEDWARRRTLAELEAAARQHGFSVSKVMDARDLHSSEHLRSRRAVWFFEDPLWGDLVLPFALRLGATPGRIRWSIRPVGFDNEYVLRKILGLSPQEVDELYREGVVGRWDPALPFASPPPDWDGKRGLFFREGTEVLEEGQR